MQIEQENYKEKKTIRPSKTVVWISILLVVVLLIVIGIVILIQYVKDSKLAISVNGQNVSFDEKTFIFQDSNVLISIKDVAPLVGYEAHNGEYKINIEDTTKMYVEAKDQSETASFYLNSTLINKIKPDSTGDYDSIEISSPVTMIDGRWYINEEGFMKAFNCAFAYNSQTNRIIIQTLPYLVEYYKTNIAEFGYDKLSEEFNNQKALIYGMIIASKDSTGKYGVVSVRTNNEIISPRYNSIEFLESEEEFIVENASGKVGIVYTNRRKQNKCKL